MRTLYFWPIIICIVIFSAGIIIGTLLPAALKLIILEAVAEKFQTILAGSTSSWLLSWHIFLNNLLVCTILYVGGFIVVIPLVIIFSNGLLIGVFMNMIYRMDVFIPGYFVSALASLIPHGLFELSAFFLAGALGVMTLLKCIFPRHIEPHVWRTTALWQSLIRFICLVIPLLIVAALIEAFVSPHLAIVLQNRAVQQHLDPQLVIQLNTQALVQANCVSSGETKDLSTLNSVYFEEGFSFMSNAVYYDGEIYDELLQRQRANVWRQTWQCANNASIRLEVWLSQDWSKKQDLLTARRLLVINGIDYHENSFQVGQLIIERLTYTLADQRIVQAVTTSRDKTIVLTLVNPEVGTRTLLSNQSLDSGLTETQ